MKIYLVGGAVRDRLLNIPVTDNDYVVVGSTVEEMLSLGYRQVGNSFPVFLEPKTNCEYALARKERKEGHGYNGFCFDFAPDITLEEDLIRRDLTINAIAEDPDGNIIDPCGGREDLKKKVLRHINDSFAEDPLRVLRVARFAARFNHLGFTVAPETMELMKSMVLQGEINYLTPERIFLEFNKVLINGDADIFIKILRNCGALGVVFPEMDNLYGIPARKYWHPEIDTGTHMELCLSYACRHNYEPIEKFAIFCHDFGKALTDKNILPSHTNHGKKGVPLIEKFCDRLRIPNNYRKVAEFIAREHSMVHTALYKSNKEILELLKRIDAFRNTIACLFVPNTYEVYWDITIENLMKRMKKEHDRFWEGERTTKALALGLTPNEVCTVASIIDEETANNAEKPMIAGMYLNRLKTGMPLQADPTVKFALQDFALKRIYHDMLVFDSPYNTYKNTGLPPGPIKVASIAGIDAVLNRVDHPYLYMCAKEDFSGTHNFAKTYQEHLKNAARYSKALNERGIK